MRKIDPVGVRNDFKTALLEIKSNYQTLKSGTGQTSSTRSSLAEQVTLSVAVLWEGFVNDLIVAYVNRDNSMFAQHSHDGIRDNAPAALRPYIKVSIPKHLSKEKVHDMLDPSGGGMVSGWPKDFTKRAKKILVKKDSKRLASMTQQERAIVGLLVALRNHLAHRSLSSKRTLDECSTQAKLPTTLRRDANKIRGVGHYLKVVQGKCDRAEIIIDKLISISAGR